MKTTLSRRRRRLHCRPGKVLLVFAIALPLLLTLVTYVVGLTYIQLTRMKLQAVIDTTATAAADRFAAIHDPDVARDVARQVARLNEVQFRPLELSADAIEFGRFERRGGEWEFFSDSGSPNAVRVTANVTVDQGLGPATLLKFLDRNVDVDVTRTSIAIQVDRDIALTADRSFWTAFDVNETLPVDLIELGPETGPVPINVSGVLPRNAPIGWTWCLPVPALSKWLQMIDSIEAFLAELWLTAPDEQVSLVTFAADGTIDQPLTFNYPIIIDTMQQLGSNFCGGPANLQKGIEAGVRSLTDPSTARPHAEKILILLVGSPEDEGRSIEAASAAIDAGVVVHVVSFGANVEVNLMEAVAVAGGGRHRHADNVLALTRTLRDIANSPRVVIVRTR